VRFIIVINKYILALLFALLFILRYNVETDGSRHYTGIISIRFDIICRRNGVGRCRIIRSSSRKGESRKHQIKHAFGWNKNIITHYTTVLGSQKIGARCCVCGKIDSWDIKEDTSVPEDRDDKEMRMIHKEFYSRWGPKDNIMYQIWIDNYADRKRAIKELQEDTA
jgi:hypothetical protein